MDSGSSLRAAARHIQPTQAAFASAPVSSMQPIVSVTNLSKTYASGFHALKNINLAIRRGEIFALLGPNGAGKTTLISTICGIVRPSEGSIMVDGHDIGTAYRAARSLIGLVPQELTTDAFETVWATVSFSRGLFGKPANPAYIEKVLRDLSLWEKRNNKIITLSGGMKRRVLIAKALSHEPRVLFLDEPTAGVDVELRRDMWQLVRSLSASGVTIILTTHYIDEAEEMADRIGVINGGEIMLVEEKAELMRKLGKKQLTLQLENPLEQVPEPLAEYRLALSADGTELIYTYDTERDRNSIIALLKALDDAGIRFKDLQTTQSSLEDIFVSLLRGDQ
ncbi:ABC-2 type transport system ATP-binding protein [Paraburkholderia phenazinium]|uniref:ABC-2 type transport system ATP-binding protein n=2 Tax=Paraburkholderia phenazinium TaxID=60549 RepID=A0A1G8KD36_9BURK|nr:ABC-2 type transport system ATP-binding protein [Paraburkholderia phenazinium]